MTSELGDSALDPVPPLIGDPVETATSAGLRYFTDARPGIRRRRVGKHFTYLATDGTTIRDSEELRRFKALGIPPAWTDVWICPSRRGHIQATGRDAKGRKQYRYHDHWREIRDDTKYTRMIAFGQQIPRIREQSSRDLSLRSLSHDKVIGTIVQLLDATAIRVGNEEYARENQSFGLTTLRRQHVDVEGTRARFHFRGKSGKVHEVDISDRRLVRAIKRCEEIPGQELFQYLDEHHNRVTVDSADVNDYLRQVTGQNFTAKDFRTWHGTVTAADSLYKLGPLETETQAKKNVNEAIKAAAAHLGNTPAICRKSYVYPGIIEAYMDGSLHRVWSQVLIKDASAAQPGLRDEEAATLAVLENTLDRHGQEHRRAS
ncbi:MAG: DNA topoisomerase IB [Chloroflexota bacterium]